jgi:hypothetical protein
VKKEKPKGIESKGTSARDVYMSIEDQIAEAIEFVNREGGCPDKLWHPQFGWVDLTKPNEKAARFHKWLQKQYDKK